MERLLWVSLAGALGCAVRYGIGVWAGERLGHAFPYGTLIVNVIGCFLAALVLELSASAATFSPTLRVALVTGFCGGLTTYSSFNYEATKLFQTSSIATGAAYVGITAMACFGAGLLGLALASRIAG